MRHAQQNPAKSLDDLRLLIPRLESLGTQGRVLPFGLPELDRYLPNGGLALEAVHEIMPAAAGDTASAFAFVMALLARMPQSGPILFIISRRALADYGRLHGHGLNALGLDPARVILVEAGDEQQTLWAIEEALRSGVPAAVAGAVGRRIDLKASQRLQLAARGPGVPLLLLRQAGMEGSSAAVTRWRIGSAEAARDRFGLVAHWRWHVRLVRCRNGRPGEWLVEWDHVAHRFRMAAAVADPTFSQGTGASILKLRAG
jgi:protein ImuA